MRMPPTLMCKTFVTVAILGPVIVSMNQPGGRGTIEQIPRTKSFQFFIFAKLSRISCYAFLIIAVNMEIGENRRVRGWLMGLVECLDKIHVRSNCYQMI